jgi:hypothetical protein
MDTVPSSRHLMAHQYEGLVKKAKLKALGAEVHPPPPAGELDEIKGRR